jgi:tripartite-type tricarboxylate transporter receptor subunit TctC
VHTLTYYGVLAPAGTPKEIVNKLNAEINAILRSDDTRARLTKLAAEPGTGSPEDFGRFMDAELKRYGEIVRISGAKAVQ